MSTTTTVIATATAIGLAAGITTAPSSMAAAASTTTASATTTAAPTSAPTLATVPEEVTSETSEETSPSDESPATETQDEPAEVYLADLQKVFEHPELGTIAVEETAETTKNTITLTVPNAQPSQFVWVSAYLDGKTYTPAFEKWMQLDEAGKVVLDARELGGIGTYVLAVRTRWDVIGYGTYTYSTLPFLTGVWSTVIEHMEQLRDRVDLIEKILTKLGIIPQPAQNESAATTTTAAPSNTAAAPSTVVIEEYVDSPSHSSADTTYLYPEKPATDATQPVEKLWQLGGANKGEIELTIDNTTAHLTVPNGKTGDWYYLWLYSSDGAQPAGWTQIGEDKTLAIDIGALPDGSYKLTVQDSTAALVGWTPITLESEESSTNMPSSTPIRTVVYQEAPLMTARDWVWIMGALLLVTVLANITGLIAKRRHSSTPSERTTA